MPFSGKKAATGVVIFVLFGAITFGFGFFPAVDLLLDVAGEEVYANITDLSSTRSGKRNLRTSWHATYRFTTLSGHQVTASHGVRADTAAQLSHRSGTTVRYLPIYPKLSRVEKLFGHDPFAWIFLGFAAVGLLMMVLTVVEIFAGPRKENKAAKVPWHESIEF